MIVYYAYVHMKCGKFFHFLAIRKHSKLHRTLLSSAKMSSWGYLQFAAWCGLSTAMGIVPVNIPDCLLRSCRQVLMPGDEPIAKSGWAKRDQPDCLLCAACVHNFVPLIHSLPVYTNLYSLLPPSCTVSFPIPSSPITVACMICLIILAVLPVAMIVIGESQ